jgi:hypothetical protein
MRQWRKPTQSGSRSRLTVHQHVIEPRKTFRSSETITAKECLGSMRRAMAASVWSIGWPSPRLNAKLIYLTRRYDPGAMPVRGVHIMCSLIRTALSEILKTALSVDAVM